MSKKYKEFSSLNLPEIEKGMLAQWRQEQAFEKSVSLREGAKTFVFYEGPPSANGMPGIHHVISRTIKDMVCRYKTMKGFKVERKGGWDTHGLPVELGVEKELGITKEDIGKKISVEEYNKKCREVVLRYKDKWDELTVKMGFWVDLQHPYITFNNTYIETVWWLLKKMYNRGLLYQSISIQPYSPAAGTGLSSHELNQPGTYKDVKDTSATVMFSLSKGGANAAHPTAKKIFDVINSSVAQLPPSGGGGAFFLAWTTTPWTLPSNLGLTVGANIDYVLVKTKNPYTESDINVILAKALFHKYFENPLNLALVEGDKEIFENGDGRKKHFDWEILAEFKGKDLEGISYEQLMPYEANQTDNPNAFKVMLGDFVTTEDGTGIVHTAPAFGADDYKVGKKYDIGILVMVDRQGKFVDGLGEFSGRYVKDYKDEPDYQDVNVDICVKLKKENRAFKVEKYEHSYPHCWRTDKPVLYYPLDAWFIKTTALKDRMIELNKTVNWKPKATGEGRFGNWLENMVDWNLSRSRFWGTPLPVWRSKRQNELFDNENIPLEYKKNIPQTLAIGDKNELISTTYTNALGTTTSIKGYLFDIRAVEDDIKRDESLIRKNIIDYNNSLDTSKIIDINGKVLNISISDLDSIDIDSLKNAIKINGRLTLIDIVDCGLSLANIDKKFYREITKEDINNIDFHKPYVDNIAFATEDGYVLFARVPDLIDVWFDSGSMPFAQWHFPFENKKEFADNYPADFICEGVDQTRGWFYTLHAISALVKEDIIEELQNANLPTDKVDGHAFKAVVSNGLVLDKFGNKMSKRLGNTIDPFDTINTYSADATRWYLMTNASPWDNLKFDLDGIKEVQRKFFGTLYNTYQFFALYANVDGFSFSEKYIPVNERPEIDRWILSSLHSLVKNVTENMDGYELSVSYRIVEDFVDTHLSNWYVRLCRRRFWKGEYEQDKIAAYQTLYECLDTLVRLIAPLSPFFSDAVFRNLNAVTGKINAESVHHSPFPKADESLIDTALEERMQLAQDVCSLILSLRKKENIIVRQPLQKVLIPVLDAGMQAQLEKVEDLIKSETNIKQIEYITDAHGIIHKKIKADFKSLGKRLGGKMKQAASIIDNFSQEQIAELEKNGSYKMDINQEIIEITPSDVIISAEDVPGWSVAGKGSLTVALDITLTEELKQEGLARMFVNRVQNIRKELKFELTDRIFVDILDKDGIMAEPLHKFGNYIGSEILADKLTIVQELQNGTDIELNDTILKVCVKKIS